MIQDFSKFKRFFAFGCSHTNYVWPTWADIISKEIPDVEYYNFGRIGLGNLFIASRIAEANKRFKFTETDLVVVMWTSYTREDRYVDGNWIGHGNIFNQNLYPESWVKEFADVGGYTISNNALIELTNSYLNNAPCTSVILKGFDIGLETMGNSNHLDKRIITECLQLYKDTFINIPIAFVNWLKQFPPTDVGYNYINREGEMFTDGHANPEYHYKYLEYLKFGLTDKSKNYTYNSVNLLKQCTNIRSIENAFSTLLGDCRTPEKNISNHKLF